MVVLDCARFEKPDLGSVHGLARRTLDARRQGFECRLLYVTTSLRDLIEFAGLDGVLRLAAGFPPRG